MNPLFPVVTERIEILYLFFCCKNNQFLRVNQVRHCQNAFILWIDYWIDNNFARTVISQESNLEPEVFQIFLLLLLQLMDVDILLHLWVPVRAEDILDIEKQVSLQNLKYRSEN